MWDKIEAQLSDTASDGFDTQMQEMLSQQPIEPPANLWLQIEADIETIDKEERKKVAIFYWFIILGVFTIGGFAYTKLTPTELTQIVHIHQKESSSSYKPSLLLKSNKTTISKTERVDKTPSQRLAKIEQHNIRKINSLTISKNRESEHSKFENTLSSFSFRAQKTVLSNNLSNGKNITQKSSETALTKRIDSIQNSTTIQATQVYQYYQTNSLETIAPSALSNSNKIDDTTYVSFRDKLDTNFKQNRSKLSLAAIVSPSYGNRIFRSNRSVKYPVHNGNFLWNLGVNIGIDINKNIRLSIGLHYNSYTETTKIWDESRYNLPLEIIQGQDPTLIMETVYGSSFTTLDTTSLRLFVPPPPPPPPPPPIPSVANISIGEQFDYEEQFSIHALHLPINFRYQWGNGKIKPVIDLGIEAIYTFQVSSMIELSPLFSSTKESIVSKQFHTIRTFNLSASLGLGIKYSIDSNWSMSFVPTFNLTLLDVNNQTETAVYPYALRFSTGVQYHF